MQNLNQEIVKMRKDFLCPDNRKKKSLKFCFELTRKMEWRERVKYYRRRTNF